MAIVFFWSEEDDNEDLLYKIVIVGGRIFLEAIGKLSQTAISMAIVFISSEEDAKIMYAFDFKLLC